MIQHSTATTPLTHLLFEKAGIGLCLVAPDGTVLRANAEWLRSTGFTLEEVLGEDIIELFPETRDMALAMHSRVRAGHRVEVPQHAQTSNGRQTWWDGSIEPVPMDGGTGLLITAREVRTGAEASGETWSAGAPRDLLATIIEQDGACVAVVTGRELRFTLVSPAYQAIAPGVPMLGRTYPEVFPEAANAGSRDRFLRVLDTGETWEFERWRAPVRGKPEATWHGRVVRLSTHPGEPPSALIVIDDVTQQALEDMLRIREDRFALCLEAAQVGTWEYDPQSQHAEWSPLCRKLLGVAGQGPVTYGQFLDAIVPEDRELADAAVRRALDPDTDGAFAVQYRVRWPDGIVHWISAVGRTHFDERDGSRRPRRMLGTVTDITREREAELALREADRRKNAFLAALSHELRSPIAHPQLRVRARSLRRRLRAGGSRARGHPATDAAADAAGR